MKLTKAELEALIAAIEKWESEHPGTGVVCLGCMEAMAYGSTCHCRRDD